MPAAKSPTGRPNKDPRTVIRGILWILGPGAQWADIPERYGSYKTGSSRFYRWRQAGIWDRMLSALQQDADAQGAGQWTMHYVAGSIGWAHQRAAGAKGGPGARSVRGSRGGFGTKIHVRCAG